MSPEECSTAVYARHSPEQTNKSSRKRSWTYCPSLIKKPCLWKSQWWPPGKGGLLAGKNLRTMRNIWWLMCHSINSALQIALNSHGSVRSIGFSIFSLYRTYSTQIHLYLHFLDGSNSGLRDNALTW